METGIDTNKTGTLTVGYFYGTDSDTEKNTPISGVYFRLYRIAAVSANGVYTLESGFAESGITDEQLNNLAHAKDTTAVIEALVNFLEKVQTEQTGQTEQTEETKPEQTEAEQTEPVQRRTAVSAEYQQAKAVTDKSGVARFENLEVGLYLLTADEWIQDELIYSSNPSLVSIPAADDGGNGWEYDVEVNVKAEAVTASQDNDAPSDDPTDDPTADPTDD
ncbi:MAG: hypothetical protein LUD16_03455, partial [Lachnospiraceae bacterium]|nr:hypothetical protein [Lachnospiraceae bacterium]